METNPYEYNGYHEYNGYPQSVPRIPQQRQFAAGSYVNAPASQPSYQHSPVVPQQKPQQKSGPQKPKSPERMPKARALDLARTLKKWITIASLASFSMFGGLVAYHQVSTAATQTASGSTQKTTPAT